MRTGTATDSGVQEELRRSTQLSVDPRALRTRQAIVGAVHELIAEGVPAPTVSEIVGRAGVSRSSFYTQFANLNELAAVIFREAFAEIESPDLLVDHKPGLSRAAATRMVVAELVAHVADHQDFYRVGLSGTFAGQYETVELFAERLREMIREVSSRPPGISVEAAAAYVAGGTLTLLRAWVLGELAGTADSVTDEVMALLPTWLISPEASSSKRSSPSPRAKRDATRRRDHRDTVG